MPNKIDWKCVKCPKTRPMCNKQYLLKHLICYHKLSEESAKFLAEECKKESMTSENAKNLVSEHKKENIIYEDEQAHTVSILIQKQETKTQPIQKIKIQKTLETNAQQVQNDVKLNSQAMARECIYLLREREFIRMNEPVYKIGKTSQTPCWKRFESYPKGSELLSMRNVVMCGKETLLKKTLMNTQGIIHRKDIGIEYFEGNIDRIQNVFDDVMRVTLS